MKKLRKRGLKLFVLEGDSELNWYGAGLSDLCQEVDPTSEDATPYKQVKSKVSDKVGGGGFIAYVSPVNFQVDIYESDRRRFPSSSGSSRPFSVTRMASGSASSQIGKRLLTSSLELERG
ncbi:MAG: hypothetical protein Q9N34_09455 [Aquificota bacterium]|nr:hypothetical protein [Aquificota bacterium]